jgi:hypothetical protein
VIFPTWRSFLILSRSSIELLRHGIQATTRIFSLPNHTILEVHLLKYRHFTSTREKKPSFGFPAAIPNQVNDYAFICEKDEIHLLDVQPGSGLQPICCTLRHAKIFGSVKMKLSPTFWAGGIDSKDINISDKIISFEKFRVSNKCSRKRVILRFLCVDALRLSGGR